MPEVIYLILVSGYFVLSYLFLIGVKKKFDTLSETEPPFVSVIIAARNEEKNILKCLNSLDEINYPKEKLEIILVNDESTDRTEEIIKQFINPKPHYLLINSDANLKLIGKAKPLAEGIKHAKGDLIFITDADCTIQKDWIKKTASFYNDDVAMVNGFTIPKTYGAFSGIQSIDFIFLLFVAGGSANLGVPISCIGNNISFRKSVYDELGGFERLGPSVTEDFLLLNSIRKLKKYRIIFLLDRKTFVTTEPCKTIKELFHQKKRWAVGGIQAPYSGLLIMGWAFLTSLLTILTPLFFSAVWLYLFAFKFLIDFFVSLMIHREIGITRQLKYFPLFFLYQTLYVVLLPFVVLLNRKVYWKGRSI